MTNEQLALTLTDIVKKLQDVIDLIDDNSPTDYSVLPPIPFKDEPNYYPPKATIDRWVHDYSAKFVYETFVKIRNWCLDNPRKMKYSKAYTNKAGKKVQPKPVGFIGGWLARDWEKRGNSKPVLADGKKYQRKYGGGH